MEFHAAQYVDSVYFYFWIHLDHANNADLPFFLFHSSELELHLHYI